MARSVSTRPAPKVVSTRSGAALTQEINSLSQDAQREIFAALAYKFTKEPQAKPFSRIEDDVWEAVQRTLGNCGIWCQQRSHLIASHGWSRTRYSDACLAVMDYVDNSCGILRRSARTAVLETILTVLAQFILTERDYTLSASTLLGSGMTLLPIAVEQSFPGYSAAGLLGKIVVTRVAA